MTYCPLLTDLTEIRAYLLNVFLPVRGDQAIRLFRRLADDHR